MNLGRQSARLSLIAATVFSVATASAQSPRPFPQPAQPSPPAPASPPPTANAPQPPAKTPVATANAAEIPSEALLGAPIYPTAQYITSYDAGRGQRFYLFGVSASYLEIVNYYRTALKQRGNELFEAPPTYQFETGRFREETMAFPPTVTIKDYTFGGSAGYPNPKRDTQPDRFSTVIQIVPAPPQ